MSRVFLLWLLVLATATGAPPPGLKITLESDRPEYWLGENVLVHFTVLNTGPEPFTVNAGGDYRGAPRYTRFLVKMQDEQGKGVPDPFPPPYPFQSGGMVFTKTLPRGEKWEESVPIMSYGQPQHEGAYTIRIAHDLGFPGEPGEEPAAEITLHFKMPDAAQAEKVIEDMLLLPKASENLTRSGERSRPYGDLFCLRLPVFRAPVLKRIRAGEAPLLEALGQMQSHEATADLLELARTAPAKIALKAAHLLGNRMPFSIRPASPGWEERLAPEVRALALRFLESAEKEEVAQGAFFLEVLGTPAEGPAALKALNRALDKFLEPRTSLEANVLDDPMPVRELVSALRALHGRGLAQDRNPSGSGGLLVYFDWLASDPAPRPPPWLQSLEAFSQGNCYPMVVAALRSIPKPMPPECAKIIARSLREERDLGARRVACEIAGASGDRQFIPLLLAQVAAEHEPWLLRAATAAAQALGAGLPLLEIWAARLPEEGLNELALDALQTVANLPGSYGSNGLSPPRRLAQRAAWTKFLHEHAEAIRAGRKFNPGDAALKPELFGTRQYYLKGGAQWPSAAAQEEKPEPF